MPPTLTEIERKILDFMVEYLRENTYQPSIREIGERFGIKSTKTVSEHLQALADKGFLERDPSRSRGVRILGVDLKADAVSLPCYRELPVEGDGQGPRRAEMYLSLDRKLAGEGRGAFFVRARAEEVGALGCLDGDFLLVEPTAVEELRDGAVVAARVEERPSFYRFERNGAAVILRPLNPGREATVVQDPSRLQLFGRVTGMFRRLESVALVTSAATH